MRKILLNDYNKVYHLDLHGNVKENPKLSGTTHNVFGIQVGVGITLAIRRSAYVKHDLFYFRIPEDWRREKKLSWLKETKYLKNIEWKALVQNKRNNWILPENAEKFSTFIAIGTKKAKSSKSLSASVIFRIYSLGISTNRDHVVYNMNRQLLLQSVERFIENYNAEVNRFHRKFKEQKLDDFIDYSKIKWSRNLKRFLKRGKNIEFSQANIRLALYRPFTKSYLYLAKIIVDELGQFLRFFPNLDTSNENLNICLSGIAVEKPFYTMLTNVIPNLAFVGFGGGCQCFPYYFYEENGRNRRDNITDWALQKFREHYNDLKITKWDIFYYVYGLLHHPHYREDFADNLKRDLPRIPLAPDFRAFSDAGRKLADLHLNYEKIEPYLLQKICAENKPLSYVVEDKMRLSKDKMEVKINESLTLRGIPPETFDYRLGNRSALDWVIDQYQVRRDDDDEIRSDPNRQDDPEYIVRLVGQVITVSIGTVQIVKNLPQNYSIGENQNPE